MEVEFTKGGGGNFVCTKTYCICALFDMGGVRGGDPPEGSSLSLYPPLEFKA